jgi:hypothetical protein
MAWTKLGSTTLSNTPSGSPTYSDDFDTDDWVDQGSGVGVNTSTERLELNSWTDDGTNNSSTLDLGSALSDTKWVIRFKFHFSAYSNTSDTTGVTFGMWANPSSTGGSSAEDSLFLWTLANAGTKITYISSNDNQAIGGTDTNLSYAWVTGTTYYVQLQRNGSSFSATIWTGSYDGTEVASETNSINGTNTGLRYFGVKSFMANRGGSWTGWLDDLQIWNNQVVGSNITVSSMSDNTFLTVITNTLGHSSAIDPSFRFNLSDTQSSAYATRYSHNGASDPTPLSNQSLGRLGIGTTSLNPYFGVSYTSNISGEKKLNISQLIDQNTAGAGAVPNRSETVSIWTQSDVIDEFDVYTGSTATWVSDSNVSVIGSDGATSTKLQDGAIYYETDTNKEYLLYNNTWTEL